MNAGPYLGRGRKDTAKMNTLGKRLQHYREQVCTAAEMAARLGVTPAQYRAWEEDHEDIPLRYASAAAGLLGIAINALLFQQDPTS